MSTPYRGKSDAKGSMTHTKPMTGFLLVLTGSLGWLALPTLTSLFASAHNERLPSLSVASSFERPFVSRTLPEKSNLAKASRVTQTRFRELWRELPLTFEASCGQTDRQVKFISRGNDYTLFLTATEAVLELRNENVNASSSEFNNLQSAIRHPPSSVLRMKLVGANSSAQVIGLNELPGKRNYLIGNDSKSWCSDVPTYSRVKYENVYPGVDMIYYGNQRQLEYDLIVAPGADPNAILLVFAGVQKIRLDGAGHLLLRMSSGEISQQRPVLYQRKDGVKREISGRYVIKAGNKVGVEVGAYDISVPLVIDPVLSYSTYLGGSGDDLGNGVAVDSAGNVYVTGETSSANFPATPGAPPTGGRNAFVTKFNRTGAIIYSTYLGGDTFDEGLGIAVDSSGNAYVTGRTSSTNFPTTTGSFQTAKAGGLSAFVAKLNSTGNALTYSTYLGGSDTFTRSGGAQNHGFAIAVDSSGNAYVTGSTDSKNFPTANALQASYNGGACGSDALSPCSVAFITKLNLAGTSLVFSTYLGGNSQSGRGGNEGRGIAVDLEGNVYVVGYTRSTSFPTANPLQAVFGGGLIDAFVVKLNAAGDAFVYSTYLGGSGDELGTGITVDSSGNAYVTGITGSTNFPITPGSFQTANAGSHAFKTTNAGSTWSATNIGFRSDINIKALAVDTITPSTLYAGTSVGVFKSTDGGANWGSAILTNTAVNALVIDPVNPSVVYAGAVGSIFASGVFKSTDAGNSWRATSLVTPINALAIDPRTLSTIYAGGFSGRFFINVSKSTDSGSTWNPTDLRNVTVYSLAIDPMNPLTLYAGTSVGVSKTTDGGNTWNKSGLTDVAVNSLVVDPMNPTRVYAGTAGEGVFKSSDAGSNWSTSLGNITVNALAIDPINSSTIYAGTIDGCVFKSIDSGSNWNGSTPSGTRVNVLAIDPKTPSAIYAGSNGSSDAFAIKLNPVGSILMYSTYLGGNRDDLATSIAVDSLGNAYVTGLTFSDGFPAKNAFQPSRRGSSSSSDAFVSKLNTAGSALVYSTYLGGKGNETGLSIAVDSFGNAYVTGSTSSTGFATVNPVQASYGGGSFDAFVIKIAVPRIISASITGKKLFVIGEGFDDGAVIIINGEEQKTRNDDQQMTTVLIGKKAGNKIAPGQTVLLQVRAFDGTLSREFPFTRPVE